MKFKIHRGANEIGGNCVEITTATTRLILDVGLPLEAFAPENQGKDTKSWLPEVPGLFASGPKVDAILLSHAHGDHFGLLDHALESIPLYLNKETSQMLMAMSLYANLRKKRWNEHYCLSGEPFQIGDITITPMAVDHSAYGALAFVLESGGERILYSGDLRFHGRKPGMARKLIAFCQKNPIDVLILEGTHVGSNRPQGLTEQELETDLVLRVRKTHGLALAMFSSVNVDRLVTYYRTAIRTGRQLVLDPYTTFVLHLLKAKGTFPNPDKPEHLKLFLPPGKKLSSKLAHVFKGLENDHVSVQELRTNPQRYLMIFRPWMLDVVFQGKLPEGSEAFYSYWTGYLDQPDMKSFQANLQKTGCSLTPAHASGHAYVQDLIGFVRSISPKQVVPIHTNNPEALMELLTKI